MTEQEVKTGTAEGEQPAQTPEQAANDLTRPTNANMRWYIIHAYSGFERKVKESLESRVQAFGLQEKIGRVVIPMETVTQVRNGKKYNMEQLVYPGYVLVEMELSDEVWHVVKATPRVTGFLGGATHPTPLSDDEAKVVTAYLSKHWTQELPPQRPVRARPPAPIYPARDGPRGRDLGERNGPLPASRHRPAQGRHRSVLETGGHCGGGVG